MLTPPELAMAQGFGSDYRLDVELDGRRLPKSAQTRAIGNSVPPNVSAALVRANVPELAVREAVA